MFSVEFRFEDDPHSLHIIIKHAVKVIVAKGDVKNFLRLAGGPRSLVWWAAEAVGLPNGKMGIIFMFL